MKCKISNAFVERIHFCVLSAHDILTHSICRFIRLHSRFCVCVCVSLLDCSQHCKVVILWRFNIFKLGLKFYVGTISMMAGTLLPTKSKDLATWKKWTLFFSFSIPLLNLKLISTRSFHIWLKSRQFRWNIWELS